MTGRTGRGLAGRYGRAYSGAFFAVLILAFAFTAHALAEPVRLRLIAFNDFHGHLEPGSKTLTVPDPDDPSRTERVRAGGAAWLAGLIAQLRGEAPNAVVFSTGDLISGAPLVSTLFRQESTIAVMNAIGLDFNIVGNHEFDAGFDELRRIAAGGCAANSMKAPFVSCALGTYSGARFPFLAANVEGPDGKPIFAPVLVKEFGGVKIGFIGVVTRELPAMVSPSGIKGLKILDEAETLNRYAKELKEQGVGAIVAVVHEGGEVKTSWNDEKCGGRSGEIFEIAKKLSADIGLLFSAHTHKGYNCVINTPQQRGLRVMQAVSYGRGVSVADLELDPATGRVNRERTRSRNIPVVNRTSSSLKFLAVPSSPAVAKIVSAYTALAAEKANRPVGRLSANVGLTKLTAASKELGTPAGRLVADAGLAATKDISDGAQVAFTNAGGVRAPLTCPAAPPCTVTYGQAFSMQPFGNNLVVMTLTGKQLREVLEDQLPAGKSEGRFSYTWKRSAPHGQRVSELRLDGAPVRADGHYRVTVNSFLAEGGDGFKTFREGTKMTGGPLDVDALVNFLATHEPYAADTESRVRVVE
jgi:5'-nucleotidase